MPRLGMMVARAAEPSRSGPSACALRAADAALLDCPAVTRGAPPESRQGSLSPIRSRKTRGPVSGRLQLVARAPRRGMRRVARVSGGGGEHGDPDLGGAAALGLAGFAAQPPGVLEHAERALDLAALLVAAEQLGDLGASQPGGALLGGRPQLVGGRIAERRRRRSRARRRRCSATRPGRPRGARGRSARSSRAARRSTPGGRCAPRRGRSRRRPVRAGRRQLAVGIDPPLPGGVVEPDRPVLGAKRSAKRMASRMSARRS